MAVTQFGTRVRQFDSTFCLLCNRSVMVYHTSVVKQEV
jgi:hypothetical protein